MRILFRRRESAAASFRGSIGFSPSTTPRSERKTSRCYRCEFLSEEISIPIYLIQTDASGCRQTLFKRIEIRLQENVLIAEVVVNRLPQLGVHYPDDLSCLTSHHRPFAKHLYNTRTVYFRGFRFGVSLAKDLVDSSAWSTRNALPLWDPVSVA